MIGPAGPSSPVAPSLQIPIGAWLALGAIVAVSLAIDLVFHQGDRAGSRRGALLWSVGWIALALAFGGWIAVRFGASAGEDYVTAYLVEKSLSVDNLFVFLVVFGRLRIPAERQRRVLQWGICGALLARAAFIAGGSALLSAWHGAVYVLGAFLVYTGLKTAFAREGGATGEGKVLPFLRRRLPFTPALHGNHFVVREAGRLVGTPLLLAVAAIELTDIVFAVDSIPAVFAITEVPFLVYASNVFAVLGLRALYVVLADLLADLEYLRYGLAAILAFTGGKMLLSGVLHVSHLVSMATIAVFIAAAVVPSLLLRRRRAREGDAGPDGPATTIGGVHG